MAFHATLEHTDPGGPDSWKCHARDVYEIGGRVSDGNLAEVLARGSGEAYHYLDGLGVPFAKGPDGRALQFVTDGSRHARACYTGPYTANDIEKALVARFTELGRVPTADKSAAGSLEALENVALARVVTDRGRAVGALLVDEAGEVIAVAAKAMVLATGGAGSAFKVNVFPPGMTGDGLAAAYEAGAELVNLEFIQIGLSSVVTKLACSGSMMRALPRFANEDDDEFLLRRVKGLGSTELYGVVFDKGASWPVSFRDRSNVLDIACAQEILSGHRVFLDYSTNPDGLDFEALKPHVWERYRKESKGPIDARARASSPLARLGEINPESIQWLRDRSIDLAAGDRVELAPAIQHFQGGVKIGPDAQTTVRGLFAAGEAAGGQHGANRPGGHALMDCQVFGKIAGTQAALAAVKEHPGGASSIDEAAGRLEAEIEEARNGEGEPVVELAARVGEALARALGVIRTAEGLADAGRELADVLRTPARLDGGSPMELVELKGAAIAGSLVCKAAETRDESRGPHLRFEGGDSSKPIARDDARWRKYIVISRGAEGPEVEVRNPVPLGFEIDGRD
jgi:succinate dehydrogenase / fumarate reductase flavoprotein subunit